LPAGLDQAVDRAGSQEVDVAKARHLMAHPLLKRGQRRVHVTRKPAGSAVRVRVRVRVGYKKA
jgi:hypothetical protein